jgi:hypothetical protein
MTAQFWFGFISAVALISTGILVAAVLLHRKGERKRQQAVDAIMVKVAAGVISPNEGRSEARAKGVH